MSIGALGVCLLVSAVTSQLPTYEHLRDHFEVYKARYNKSYEHELIEKFRLMIYADNKYAVDAHNARYEKGLETYQVALNQYSDLLHHEFQEQNTCFVLPDDEEEALGGTYVSPLNASVPGSMDWRKEGAVTEVKNQGNCGSCWSFSSTGSLEGQHFRKSGKLVSLSEQNLVDCVTDAHGCLGGSMAKAFDYIKSNEGIDTQDSYAYEETDDGICRFKKDDVGATCTGYVRLPTGDEVKLMEAVATIGPVSVAIDAKHDGFRHYSSGVYYENDCNNKPKHAVLVVGYGKTDEGVAYWLVKNSWGASWGQDGYIMMAKDRDSNCAITSYAIYPTV